MIVSYGYATVTENVLILNWNFLFNGDVTNIEECTLTAQSEKQAFLPHFVLHGIHAFSYLEIISL